MRKRTVSDCLHSTGVVPADDGEGGSVGGQPIRGNGDVVSDCHDLAGAGLLGAEDLGKVGVGGGGREASGSGGEEGEAKEMR
jgi:hypothetical protein